MKSYPLFILIFCFLSTTLSSAQNGTITTQPSKETHKLFQKSAGYDALAPSKAAFFSAVLPGLGQAYNHSYWKIPIIYTGLGISIYAYIKNNEKYHDYRNAYKRRLAGYSDDQFQGKLSDDGLIEAQKQFKKYKELSIIAAVIIYALNVVDANVEAHLQQFNVSKNLALRPQYNIDQFTGKSNYGISLNFNF